WTPVAVLLLPLVLLKSALTPRAVFALPVVLLTRAPVPRLVLLCAAAMVAKEREKMSVAISMKKDEAALVELRNIFTLPVLCFGPISFLLPLPATSAELLLQRLFVSNST